MSESRTERASCRFVVEKAEGAERYVLKLEVFHEALPTLRNAVLGFNLLSGVSLEQAKKIAEMLNENVFNLFLTLSDAHPMSGKSISVPR